MERMKKKTIIYIIVAFLAGAAVTGGVTTAIYNGLLGTVKISKDDYDAMSAVYEKYGKLEQIYESIDKYYYEEIKEQDLLDGAYKGLVSGLNDPYSSYMTAEEYEDWKGTATGDYDGVGITLSMDEQGNYYIVGINADSPAEKAGLKEGDYILSVDGEKYDDLEVMARNIRGEAGTEVELVYARSGDGEEKKVTITREEIIQDSVEYEMLDGKIGYIEISSFISGTAEDFRNALAALEKDGAKGLVLDLRDNGGGLVDSCVEIADEFLDEGVVTYVENKAGERSEYDAEDGKTGLKTVVLVNGNSASSSEILAAALQDNGVELVGETTYGKGVIQSTIELEGGSALKLTIMQYFSPKGNAIHEKGVTPDYEVANEEGTGSDAQLQKALSLF
ncbi:MAG: S41 family peptidase [Bacillota bacterium]|nr:S41 family peptidase [Bacillota bacterium]